MSPRPQLTVVPDFDAVADELYALPLEQFIQTRTQYERQARQAGDPDLAARIKALAKPNVAAWLLNRLARERREELQPLLELGAGLREATQRLAGDQLRQLSRQQHEVVYALVQQARLFARDARRPVSDDTVRGMEQTLHAALVDERVGEQLLEGRLTEPIERSGLGDAAPPSAPHATGAGESAQLEQDLAAAERAVGEASSVHHDAVAEASQARERVEQTRDEVAELHRRLELATAAAEAAQRDCEEADAGLRQTEHALDAAERRRDGLRDRLPRGETG